MVLQPLGPSTVPLLLPLLASAGWALAVSFLALQALRTRIPEKSWKSLFPGPGRGGGGGGRLGGQLAGGGGGGEPCFLWAQGRRWGTRSAKRPGL